MSGERFFQIRDLVFPGTSAQHPVTLKEIQPWIFFSVLQMDFELALTSLVGFGESQIMRQRYDQSRAKEQLNSEFPVKINKYKSMLHRQMPLIYAREFIFCIDAALRKVFDKEIINSLEAIKIRNDCEQFRAIIKEVRDSIAHEDERVKGFSGTGKNKKEITSGFRIFGSLTGGDSFTMTTSDNTIMAVPITPETFNITCSIAQAYIDLFIWDGPPQPAAWCDNR